MSLRSKWEFEYTAKNLAEAAARQLAFRVSRVAFWKEQQAEVIKKIKDTGMIVHEDIAALAYNNAKYSANTSARGGAQIVIDPTLQTDLNKCHMKIQEHSTLESQYKAWQQVLEGNSESRVKLDHDDWMFFFGK